MSESSTSWLSSLDDRRETRDTVMVAFAGFTVLVWDHLITFDDEVDLVWKRDKGLLSYLFLVNRYLTPLGFIVNLVAFTLPGWGIETLGTHSFISFLNCDASLYIAANISCDMKGP
ncbi:hypothetical protein L210DRAFT_3538321 [Boletus edulis BED1]|uniref:DUF6533 domain-containing protein n=1 Tax=Boletus edulis BED1 TaxID=1328754 RepID=A0AAD4GF13_BOLED|nr:hypothetical protein L210DRAFT_3538321 [Boletus edulis BED1]